MGIKRRTARQGQIGCASHRSRSSVGTDGLGLLLHSDRLVVDGLLLPRYSVFDLQPPTSVNRRTCLLCPQEDDGSQLQLPAISMR
eukprot:2158130-Rhodomonas_salina.1